MCHAAEFVGAVSTVPPPVSGAWLDPSVTHGAYVQWIARFWPLGRLPTHLPRLDIYRQHRLLRASGHRIREAYLQQRLQCCPAHRLLYVTSLLSLVMPGRGLAIAGVLQAANGLEIAAEFSVEQGRVHPDDIEDTVPQPLEHMPPSG